MVVYLIKHRLLLDEEAKEQINANHFDAKETIILICRTFTRIES